MAGALPVRLQRARQIVLPRADGVTLTEDYVATPEYPKALRGASGISQRTQRRSKGPFPGLPGRTNPPSPPRTFLVYFYHYVHRLS